MPRKSSKYGYQSKRYVEEYSKCKNNGSKDAQDGGTFGVMKETHDLTIKVGRPTARQIDNKKINIWRQIVL